MTSARVHLRYRPASDVLSGDIELSTLDADGAGQVAAARAVTHSVAESPDADSHLEWQRSDLDDVELLSAFQIVHAGARLAAGTLPSLPEALLPIARNLVQSGSRTLADSTTALARMQAKVEVVVHLSRQQLVRGTAPLTVPPSWSVDRSQISAVTGSLRRLSGALHSLANGVAEQEAIRTEQLARLLLELASVLSKSHGTPSPGTTAAARRAVRGGLPLAASERALLRTALGRLDATTEWPTAIAELESLNSTLEQAPQPPTRRTGPLQ